MQADLPRASCCDYHAKHGIDPQISLLLGRTWDCDDDMDDPPHRLDPPPLPADDDR